MLKVLLALSLVAAALPGHAAPTREESIKSLFVQVNKTNKGALGPNSYQRPGGRTQVLQGGAVSGAPRDTLFTAAFRSELGQKLAAQNFYVGNRFSTSYYELYAKYLATPKELKDRALKMDLPAFYAATQMAEDARSISRHTMLEQFYMRKFPQALLTRANLQRGTADAENETTFYSYFVQYLAQQAASPQDYLNVFELQKRFNLTGDHKTVSLAKVRDTVAALYDQFAIMYLDGPFLREFKAIRNSIHNYLTPVVVSNLNVFIKRYKDSAPSDQMAEIVQLRDQLVLYYKTDKKTLQTWVTKVAAHLPADAAKVVGDLADRGPSLAQLEALADLAVRARVGYFTHRDPEILHFIIRANQYLQAQLGSRELNSREDWAARARIALDASFASGLLLQDAWQAAKASLQAPALADAGYANERAKEFGSLFVQADGLIRETMQPALADWTLNEKSMDGFVDDVLRSSFLTELDQLSAYLKKKFPNVPSASQPATAYTIETEGEAYGYLVYLPVGAPKSAFEALDKTMIPIFAELPLDLGVTAAILTEQPQTPLSHVNIKSKSRGTPNAYFPNASSDPLFKDLIAKRALVKIKMLGGRVTVREATLAEAQKYWGKMHAPTKISVDADLSESRIRSTRELRTKDVLTVGAKAANYGEGESILGELTILEGLSVPFSYYKGFIDTNRFDANLTLAQRIEQLLKDPRIHTEREYLVQSLKEIQDRMRSDDMQVDPYLIQELSTKLGALYPGQPMRFRSSSNSEDLANFSGAGLYDSYTYDPTKPKKTIAAALKKTWASVWNLRAFDEREHFGIEHSSVYMAMLVSPSFSEEVANGVAISRNIVDPSLGRGLYINTQVGEELVTNPDPSIVPEELLILDQPDAATGQPYTLRYLKYSKLHPEGPIMTDAEALRLGKYLARLNRHFRKIFDPSKRNPNFAIDIEFKVDNIGGERGLFIKQARPYVAK